MRQTEQQDEIPPNQLAFLQQLMRRVVAYNPVYCALGVGTNGAIFLSQALFLSSMETVKANAGWFFHTQNQYAMETGLSDKEQLTVRKKLKSLTILQEEKRGCPPKIWQCLDQAKLLLLLHEKLSKKENMFKDDAEGGEKLVINPQFTASGEINFPPGEKLISRLAGNYFPAKREIPIREKTKRKRLKETTTPPTFEQPDPNKKNSTKQPEQSELVKPIVLLVDLLQSSDSPIRCESKEKLITFVDDYRQRGADDLLFVQALEIARLRSQQKSGALALNYLRPILDDLLTAKTHCVESFPLQTQASNVPVPPVFEMDLTYAPKEWQI